MVSQPPMVADDLRRQADIFVDLAELKLRVGRVPSERPGPRELRQQSPQLTSRGAVNENDVTK
jgi:pyruvate kinase